MNRKITLLLVLILLTTVAYSQKLSVKTNLLYGSYTCTPNLSFEVGLGKRSTLDFGAGYNPWHLKGTKESNKKLVHLLGNIEYRYWLCESFSGHFFGAHVLGTQFNIGQHELPMIFGKGSKDYRYEGYGYGGGLSYGYHWILGNRWGLEAQIGLGYARLHYDKYNCKTCGQKIGPEKRNYFGPTKAGISLIYIIK